MQDLLILSRQFEATGIFNYILISIGALCVVGTVILSKKGSL